MIGRQGLLASLQSTLKKRFCLFITSLPMIELRHFAQQCRCVRMVRGKHLLVKKQCSLEKDFCLRIQSACACIAARTQKELLSFRKVQMIFIKEQDSGLELWQEPLPEFP